MTNATTLHIKVKAYLHSRVTTREDGDVLRNYIVKLWEDVDCFVLDFDKLQVASVSFLDEAFGMLAESFPQKEITKKLKFENMDENDNHMLQSILKSRISQFKKGKSRSDALASTGNPE